MNIRKAVQYFRVLPTTKDGDVNIEDYYSALSQLCRYAKERKNKYSLGILTAFVIDRSNIDGDKTKNILEQRGLFNAGLYIVYKDKSSIDLQRLYDDLRAIDIFDCKIDRPFKPAQVSEIPPDDNGQIELDYETPFFFPIDFRFGENYEDIQHQKNRIRFVLTALPDEDVLRSTREELRDFDIKIFAPEKDGYGWKTCDDGIISCTLSPETVIEARWEGEDFIKKGVSVYDTLRGLFLENHIKTASEFAGREIEYAQRDKNIILNHNNPGANFSDMHCSFQSQIPIKSGDKPLIGELHFGPFYGRL